MSKIKKFKNLSFKFLRQSRESPIGVASLRTAIKSGQVLSFKMKGFSLIFALIIVSVVASVGISIFEMFFLELSMTGSIRESQHAFYAADSGAECVLYWDLKNSPPLSTSKTITCNNENKTVGGSPQSGFQLLFSDGSCSDVVINIDSATGQRKIESLGRSKYSGSNCANSVPRRTERGLEVKYD